MKIAIFAATTAGPVRIERIVGEDAPLSQVYQGRGYEPMQPVSARYARFVAPGGPVARAFGPAERASFRLEVSGPIGDGNSWELAFFVAHGLARRGELAGPGEAYDKALILTGLVDVDFRIGPVGHIDQKIAAADTALDNARPFTFVLPKAEAAAAGRPGLDLLPAENALDLLHRLTGLPTTAPRLRRPFGLNGAGIALAGALALASLAAVGVWSGMDAVRAARTTMHIQVMERRPPEGGTCAQVQFGRAEPNLVAVATEAADRLTPSRSSGLCGLAFSSDAQAVAWIEVSSGRYLEPPESTHAPGSPAMLGPDHPWVIDLPRSLEAPFAYRIVVEVGAPSAEADLAWLSRQADRERAIGDLRKKGLTVLTVSHRVEP